jgi:D-alanine-D-alanine ligase-like ATP-grasp enzyme
MTRPHAITAPAQFGRVAVLLGGTSSEREVSLVSMRPPWTVFRNCCVR